MLERLSQDELRTRLGQQEAVAELALRALVGWRFADLADEAVRVAEEHLGAPFVSVVEVGDGTSPFLLRSSSKPPGVPDPAALAPRGAGGQTAYTLESAKPVVVADLTRERRFRVSARLIELGAMSSATVAIEAGGTRHGVLGASRASTGGFSEHDVAFLQGLARTLGAALERERALEDTLSGQRALEEALSQASEGEARFRELAEAAPVFIWTADADGLVDFINRGWLEFTGRALEEELGDTWALGVHPDDAEAVRSTWWRAFSRRVPWEREYRLRRHDGEYRWIVDRGLPRFRGDELLGYVGTATDIHERKEIEEKLSRAYERDHEVAETLQRSLLPESLPAIDGVGLEARYLPAARGTAIGGDWYDAIELDDGRVAVVVGDVVGHGLRAATMMGQLRNAFRAYALVETSPAETLARLNRLLSKDGRDTMATALYIVLDRDTGELWYCNAGHPPALVISADESYFLEGGRSVPLGTADPAAYRDETGQIGPGTTLVLYTDGLVERRDTLLDDRLAQLATVAGVADGDLGDVCDQILTGVLGGNRPADDVALLAVRPEPVPADMLSLRLPADPAALVKLRARLGRFLHAAGAGEQERFEITLSACEAAGNAIEHAYGPSDAEFELDARLQAGTVVVTVSDSGSWREPRGEDRGRGLHIIQGLMDQVEVTRDPRGTTVLMRRRLTGAAVEPAAPAQRA